MAELPRKDIEQLLEQAIALDGDRRASFLKEACGDDRELHRELASLLAHFDSAQNDGFLEPNAAQSGDRIDSALREQLVQALRVAGDSSIANRGLSETRTEAHGTDRDRNETVPSRVGRYQVQEEIGRGAFGVVYRARDEQLARDVALKVPRRRFGSASERAQFLVEARAAAELEHAGIVQVYDVVVEESGPPEDQVEESVVYVVQRLVSGPTLAAHLEAQRPLAPNEAAGLAASMADALAHAHERRLIHSDLKPANVLLEGDSRKPVIADLGLAVHQAVQSRQRHIRAGTPHYMAPEQVRGERHRLDGRTDIWALGVILFEMLTGQRPFSGETTEDLLDNIVSGKPWPIRQARRDVPEELARITERCLQARMSDRYQAAADVADDLRRWVRKPDSGKDAKAQAAARIVPQGLRAFTGEDQDFFLDLLPGPRDRDGLPESIRFWKSRLEETSPNLTFAVGLIYGPSGCGKSSFVQAGLLPRLANHVAAIRVEATAEQTETVLVNRLRGTFPDLSDSPELLDLLGEIREGRGVPPDGKLVIFLDQFEQWLHRHPAETDAPLIRALRQCDGSRVQCVLLVRDDFWLATSRFLQALEIPLLENDNTRLVDLFDVRHAEEVLVAFGRSYGRLPDAELSDAQRRFVELAIQHLAIDGKVICVRLALFAEMVKSKEWVPETLDRGGGVEGLGMVFLEETFSSRTAPPEHRLYEGAARSVLEALLPESGTEIKGHMRPRAELAVAAGLGDQSREFASLLRILDTELRLITPTDAIQDPIAEPREDAELGGRTRAGHLPTDATAYYQLTHDYLVPSLREWLTRKQQQSRRGRAVLRLADLAHAWKARPESRNLPSTWEYLSIRLLTRKREWDDVQRSLMRRAGSFHARRWLAVFLLAALGLWGGIVARNRIREDRLATEAAGVRIQNETRARGLVETLLAADIRRVPELIPALDEHRQWVDPLLRQRLGQEDAFSPGRLRASLALLPVDAAQAEYLVEHLIEAPDSPVGVLVLVDQLTPYGEAYAERLWNVMFREPDDDRQHLRVACLLAATQPSDVRWTEAVETVSDDLVRVSATYFGYWVEGLRPVAGKLVPPVVEVYHERDRPVGEHLLAKDVLVDYAVDLPAALVDVIQTAEGVEYEQFFGFLENQAEQAVRLLEESLLVRLEPSWQDDALNPDWSAPADEAIQAVEANGGATAERWAFCQTMPLGEFEQVVTALEPSGFRLHRVRPFTADGELLVGATWMRDGQHAIWTMGSAEEVRRHNEDAMAAGLQPNDVSAIAQPDGSPPVQYAAVWVEPAEDDAEKRMFVGEDGQNRAVVERQLDEAGFDRRLVSSFANGRYSMVLERSSAIEPIFVSIGGFDLSGNYFAHLLQSDMQLSLASPVTAPEERDRENLALARSGFQATPDSPASRVELALALYTVGALEEADLHLDTLLSASPGNLSVLELKSLVAAKRGDEATANEYADLYAMQLAFPRGVALRARIAILLGSPHEGIALVEEQLERLGPHPDHLYNLAAVYCIAAYAVAETDAAMAAIWEERAVATLRRALDCGFNQPGQLTFVASWDPLRERAHFQDLLEEAGVDRVATATWDASNRFESVVISALDPEENRRRSAELARRGFRPVSFSGLQSPDGKIATASLWHRPLVSETAKDDLARRQAAAAATLLRLGQAGESVWSFLEHNEYPERWSETSDPRTRSFLVHRAADIGADPQHLVDRFAIETDDSVRRAILLALGEYPADALEADVREELIAELLELYRSHPDAGLHGAIGWLLERWQHGDRLESVRSALVEDESQRRARERETPREWYVTTQGQTMVAMEPAEYWMGCGIATDPIRQSDEYFRPMRLMRRFAIADTEVTKEQYRRFEMTSPHAKQVLADSIQLRTYIREERSPIVSTTWYEAAAYCNWLSAQEGIPENQWCYVPNANGEFAAGMRARVGYVNLHGYRLPSEAEWEYACRAGTATGRYYGYSEQLLPKYARYNFDNRLYTAPVASLKPNDFGLFDMLGNVKEWNHHHGFLMNSRFSSHGNWIDYAFRFDFGDHVTVFDEFRRIDRGGSFMNDGRLLRSANRNYDEPSRRAFDIGFRVARTIPSTEPNVAAADETAAP